MTPSFSALDKRVKGHYYSTYMSTWAPKVTKTLNFRRSPWQLENLLSFVRRCVLLGLAGVVVVVAAVVAVVVAVGVVVPGVAVGVAVTLTVDVVAAAATARTAAAAAAVVVDVAVVGVGVRVAVVFTSIVAGAEFRTVCEVLSLAFGPNGGHQWKRYCRPRHLPTRQFCCDPFQ